MTKYWYDHISNVLKEDLPGSVGQNHMSPVPIKNYQQPIDGYKSAGVVLLLYPKQSDWHILFIKRASNHSDDKHAGQISFPGGMKEPEDLDMQACAKRELKEEVGVSENEYEILGALSPIYVYVSNFLVSPFLAISKNPLTFTPELAEVEHVIEYPLKAFLNFANRKVKDLPIRNTILKNVPYFDLNGGVLWGATAMMLSEFLIVLERQNIQKEALNFT